VRKGNRGGEGNRLKGTSKRLEKVKGVCVDRLQGRKGEREMWRKVREEETGIWGKGKRALEKGRCGESKKAFEKGRECGER
jgi:hypothetical protein